MFHVIGPVPGGGVLVEVDGDVDVPHEHCRCVVKLAKRVAELEQAQAAHVETHRREALIGQPLYDRRGD